MRIINRTEPVQPDEQYLIRLAQEYKNAKEAQEQFEKRTNALKKELSEAVDTYGTEDDKGHRWLKVGDFSLKRERRIQRSLNTNEAEEWAKQNNLWDSVKEVVEVLDEDKLLALAWENNELEDTIQAFYKEKEIWAFRA